MRHEIRRRFRLPVVVPLLALALLGAGCGSSPATKAREARQKAPDFSLADTDGKQVALHDLLARGPVLLAFFPKAFTAG